MSPKETIKYTYTGGYWSDQLIEVEKIDNYGNITVLYNMTYDYQGNPDTYGEWTFEWEGRELVRATKSDQEITYRYNDQGIRTYKKVANGTTTEQRANNYIEYSYFVEGDKVLAEKIETYENKTNVSSEVITYTYDVDGKIISMSQDDQEYFYIRNMLGDITRLVDINGNIVVSYTYDEYGNIIDSTQSEIAQKNPYRYRGYRYDNETDFYYLNSRYYNPELGRFINADGLVGEQGELLAHNMYAYAMNNPIMMVDPSGYLAWRRPKKWLLE